MDAIKSLFLRGGPIMWPLLLCSLASLTVTVERLLFWWRERRGHNPDQVAAIFRQTEGGAFEEALEEALAMGERTKDGIFHVLASGLQERRHSLSKGLEMAAGVEMTRMKQGLGVLDTIITMSPLLGILGTVIGIIESFDLLGLKGVADPQAVIHGIAQALITTASGLSIALISLLPYNYLLQRVNRAARDLEQLGTRFELAYKKGLEHEGRKRH